MRNETNTTAADRNEGTSTMSADTMTISAHSLFDQNPEWVNFVVQGSSDGKATHVDVSNSGEYANQTGNINHRVMTLAEARAEWAELAASGWELYDSHRYV